MSVRIESIDVIILQDSQADYVKFEGSYQNVLVIIKADNGMIGIGETDSPPRVIEAIIKTSSYNSLSQGLEELLLGEDLDDPKRLWNKMFNATQWHGRVGVTIHAMSAIDIALWDLYSKIHNKPVYEFLGGLKHKSISAYATIYPMEKVQKDWEQQIQDVLDKGFKKIKICVESWWSDVNFTLKTLKNLRTFVGPNIDLMLDVALEITDVKILEQFIPTLEELDFKWLEAPLPLWQIKEHKYLVSKYNIPIGVGDLGLTTKNEFDIFINENAFDIAQPDLTMFGGFTQYLELKKALLGTKKRIIPHAYNTNITIAANLQVLCSQEKKELLEYSTSPSILRKELTNETFILDSNGDVLVNENSSGLGLTINWDIVKKCRQA